MRVPASPPSPTEIVRQHAEDISEFLHAISSPAVSQFVQDANDKYLHWEKLRYHPMPDGIDPMIAWFAVYQSRNLQLRSLEISFAHMDEKLRFWVPPKHQEWLHFIDQQAGGVVGTDSGTGIPRDSDKYLINSLMEEAIASSQLEGALTTRRAAKAMLRKKRRPRDRAEQMIANNYHAILELRDLKNEGLTPELLRHVQEVLTKDAIDVPGGAGRFRTDSDQVAVVDSKTDEVIHVPPSAKTVEERIGQLCRFANADIKPFIHPVIKAIVLHFALGFIHPFVDGNGRTARAIFYWSMLKSGYWLFEYLPISRVFLDAPTRYGLAYLYAETDSGDVTYFTHYHLQVIKRSIRS
jgi:Fic family protein